jgi:hypothetical protein
MRLVRVNDDMEDAWLRSTANTRGMTNVLLGATDSARTGYWVWADGVQFYTPAGAVGTLYNNWAASFPSGAGHCTQMIAAGTWENRAATEAVAYACER